MRILIIGALALSAFGQDGGTLPNAPLQDKPAITTITGPSIAAEMRSNLLEADRDWASAMAQLEAKVNEWNDELKARREQIASLKANRDALVAAASKSCTTAPGWVLDQKKFVCVPAPKPDPEKK